jgi:tRNA (cytidine32/uridine32-2'-O)-methyltransferase
LNQQLQAVRIVLVNTYHPGNIGSTIRAMKTMGLSQLALVNPRSFPDAKANSLAAGATDLLEQINVFTSLEQAIADRTQVFATSARQAHTFTRPQKSAEQAADWISQNNQEKIAIVFGGERDGLSAAQIALCQQILYIPGNPEYSVLNLASAVQIVCYELFKCFTVESNSQTASIKKPRANQQELNYFFEHTEHLLSERGYIREGQASDSMKKLRTLVNRIQPTSEEVSLLRGMHKALARTVKND